jgi:hypothetical protein
VLTGASRQPARGGVYLGRIHWLCQLTSSRSSCSKREEAPATPVGKTEASRSRMGMARNPSRPDHSFSAAKLPYLAKRRSPGRCTGLPPTSPADGGKPPDHVIGWPQKLIWRSGGSKKAEARRAPTHRAPGTAACSLQGRSIAAALSLKAAQSDWFRTPPSEGLFLFGVMNDQEMAAPKMPKMQD